MIFAFVAWAAVTLVITEAVEQMIARRERRWLRRVPAAWRLP